MIWANFGLQAIPCYRTYLVGDNASNRHFGSKCFLKADNRTAIVAHYRPISSQQYRRRISIGLCCVLRQRLRQICQQVIDVLDAYRYTQQVVGRPCVGPFD